MTTKKRADYFLQVNTPEELDQLHNESDSRLLESKWYIDGFQILGLGMPPLSVNDFVSALKRRYNDESRRRIITLMKGHGFSEQLVQAVELL